MSRQKDSPLRGLAERWPSPIVARNQIGEFTNGLISEKHIANLDSQGKGPRGRLKVGGRVCYTVESLIQFLEERSSIIDARHINGETINASH